MSAEPEVIAKAREHVTKHTYSDVDCSCMFMQVEHDYYRVGHLLAAYDALRAERDALAARVTLLEEWRVLDVNGVEMINRRASYNEFYEGSATKHARWLDHRFPQLAPHRVVRLAYVSALAPDDAGVRDA